MYDDRRSETAFLVQNSIQATTLRSGSVLSLFLLCTADGHSWRNLRFPGNDKIMEEYFLSEDVLRFLLCIYSSPTHMARLGFVSFG